MSTLEVGTFYKVEVTAVGTKLVTDEDGVYVIGDFSEFTESFISETGESGTFFKLREGFIELVDESTVLVSNIEGNAVYLVGTINDKANYNPFESGNMTVAIYNVEEMTGHDLSLIEKYFIKELLEWNADVGKVSKQDIVAVFNNYLGDYTGSSNGGMTWERDRDSIALLVTQDARSINVVANVKDNIQYMMDGTGKVFLNVDGFDAIDYINRNSVKWDGSTSNTSNPLFDAAGVYE